MNDRLSLAREILYANIVDRDFKFKSIANESGTFNSDCSDVFITVNLKKPELLYLLKGKINYDELFKGMNIKQFDLDNVLEPIDYTSQWGDLNIYVSPNSSIPAEIEDLEDFITDKDSDKDEARKRLLDIKDGIYTFNCCISTDHYYINNNVDVKIHLTAEEIIKLLYEDCRLSCNPVHFNDIFYDTMEASELEDRLIIAAKKAHNLNFYLYGEENNSLSLFLDSWTFLITNILSGDIESKDVYSWLEYFDVYDELDLDMPINIWHALKYTLDIDPMSDDD